MIFHKFNSQIILTKFLVANWQNFVCNRHNFFNKSSLTIDTISALQFELKPTLAVIWWVFSFFFTISTLQFQFKSSYSTWFELSFCFSLLGGAFLFFFWQLSVWPHFDSLRNISELQKITMCLCNRRYVGHLTTMYWCWQWRTVAPPPVSHATLVSLQVFISDQQGWFCENSLLWELSS